MPRNTFPPIALAATLTLCATAGQAASVSSTTLSDLHITLLDLTPGAGVDPFIALDPLSRSTALAGAVAPGASTYWMNQGLGAFDPVSVSGIFAGEGTGGAASFAGDPFGAGATLATSAVAQPSFLQGVGEAYIDTQPSGFNTIAVGAHTQVSFSGLAWLTWNASDPRAAAYGDVSMSFMRDAPGGLVVVDQDEFAAGWLPGGGSTLTGAAADTVGIEFMNDSDEAVVLDYFVNVFAGASEVDVPPIAVDEPGRLALLLAGIAPVLLALRRRRR
ncbi:MAG: PEP-CTERM sorting domain-containing protein [Betaproteobacteria bacterium]